MMDVGDYVEDTGGNGGYDNTSGNIGFGASGDRGFIEGGNSDYSNEQRSYSIQQREDIQANWNQGPFTTSIDELDKATYITDDIVLPEGGDNEKTHDISISHALEAASFMKDSSPNENGEAPMSLLLADLGDHEEATDVHGDGCGPVDFLYYSTVFCCTIL